MQESGNVSVVIGGEVHHASAGDTIFVPCGIPHTFKIKSPVARTLTLITPGGFEEWFKILGEPATDFKLPDRTEPPTAGFFARMRETGRRLKVRILPDPVNL